MTHIMYKALRFHLRKNHVHMKLVFPRRANLRIFDDAIWLDDFETKFSPDALTSLVFLLIFVYPKVNFKYFR